MSSNSTLPAGFVEGSWWYYAPNKVAPIVFASLFLVSGIWHFYQTHILYKSARATSLFPFAAFLFVSGYVIRELGAFHYFSLDTYFTSSVILLTSPPIYEAGNCFALGRLMYYIPYHAPMHPWRLLVTFAGLQMIVEAVDISGATRALTPSFGMAYQNSGKILLKISLIMQLFNMLCFIGIALRFEYNCRRAGVFPDKLRSSLRILYISCALISIRTIYRTVEWFETAENNPNDPSSFPPVLRNEAYFYVFEASVMLINTFLINIFHPMKCLPQNYNTYLAPDGVTEVEGVGIAKDPRRRWQRLVDPFDIYGLITKRDQKYNVWVKSTDGSTTTSTDGLSSKEKFGWGNWQNQDDLVRVV